MDAFERYVDRLVEQQEEEEAAAWEADQAQHLAEAQALEEAEEGLDRRVEQQLSDEFEGQFHVLRADRPLDDDE